MNRIRSPQDVVELAEKLKQNGEYFDAVNFHNLCQALGLDENYSLIPADELKKYGQNSDIVICYEIKEQDQAICFFVAKQNQPDYTPIFTARLFVGKRKQTGRMRQFHSNWFTRKPRSIDIESFVDHRTVIHFKKWSKLLVFFTKSLLFWVWFFDNFPSGLPKDAWIKYNPNNRIEWTHHTWFGAQVNRAKRQLRLPPMPTVPQFRAEYATPGTMAYQIVEWVKTQKTFDLFIKVLHFETKEEAARLKGEWTDLHALFGKHIARSLHQLIEAYALSLE